MDQTLGQPKVLCIDDTPDVCILVRRLLSSTYQVLEANDGLVGIELAEREKPNLILVDLQLPQLTGYEVATRLKSILPEVPIVALTADVSANVRERVLASGCDGYISKPLDPDEFVDQIRSYLAGEREKLEDESYLQAYHQTLVARMEEKVRELTQALQQNAQLNERNLELLEKERRQARLLVAAAKVGRTITSILDLETLLDTTVDLICDEFDVYYVGIFLMDKSGDWAELHAGKGEARDAMLATGYKIRVADNTPVGHATFQRKAILTSGISGENEFAANPHLPNSRSEIALPLLVGNTLVGALSVHNDEAEAFSEEDITALQAMADQLAIAINNARLLNELESTHQELVETKTFQVIATATGEAIHWVGNKAAPIPGSVSRISDDLSRYIIMALALLDQVPEELRDHKFAQMLAEAGKELTDRGLNLGEIQDELDAQPLKKLQRMLSLASIFEDLEIIESSSRSILGIKEDLIGPARRQKPEIIQLPELLTQTIASMGISKDVVRTLFAEDVLPVEADRMQLDRVFINLIKNAMEAMDGVEDKKLFVWARPADEDNMMVVDVIDNGVGIPPDQVEKIWMAFYTTKGGRGGTGLGLPACAQIVGQLGGKITVGSDVGLGTTFSVYLPAATEDAEDATQRSEKRVPVY